MGVADALTMYPDLLKPFFVAGNQSSLTAGEHRTFRISVCNTSHFNLLQK